ncbi:MAG: diaminopimelate decarboxylase [Acidobacteria bacterium]|nr:diaminopimelate decarboxylase [Acidobacteriota bacterium]MCA1637773.1 diaminopimelate decarboxylase [Acidobacteriota bacterium]
MKNWEIENFLEVKNNQLHISGVSAIELAEKYDTPLFVFSEGRIRQNIERLKRAENFIDCKLKICYAAKANSNMAILRVVKNAGADLEVNSGGELWKALKMGFAPKQIIFNGTSKEIWELENAVNAGIYAIQVDSLLELALIEETARRLDKRVNVSLRLVPEIETKTHSGLQTALLTSKFGMMPDEALSAFHVYKDSKFLNLSGIHLHIGSQNPEAAPYAAALKMLFENLVLIYNETGLKLSHLNLGGGFPVNYLHDDSHAIDFPQAQREMFSANLEPAEVLENAWRIVKETASRVNASHLLENTTLLLEPGRSVISDAGVCLTTVRNIKERPLSEVNLRRNKSSLERARQKPKQSGVSFGLYDIEYKFVNPKVNAVVWLLTNAGFNILLSMETYKWYYHLISAERAGEAHNFPYKLAGPLCDGGDVYFDIEGLNRLPDYRLLPENVQPGEVLALLNCGAYSLAQMSQYNGRFLPAVVLIDEDGKVELVRRRDNYEDLVTNDIF